MLNAAIFTDLSAV